MIVIQGDLRSLQKIAFRNPMPMLKLKFRDELIRWITTGNKTNSTEDPRDRYKTARPGSSISFKKKIRLQGIRPNWIKAILNKKREPYSWMGKTNSHSRKWTVDDSRPGRTDATKKADSRIFLEAYLDPPRDLEKKIDHSGPFPHVATSYRSDMTGWRKKKRSMNDLAP